MEENLNNFIFCTDCGKKLSIKATTCPECGCPTKSDNNIKTNDGHTSVINDRFLPTLLLCWFVGVFGIHRFYTGHTTIGILQLLTLGGCGIWTIIDLVIIISGNFKDSYGNSIRYNN